MTEKQPTSRTRIYALAAAAVTAWTVLIASDPGGFVVMARCAVGDGFGYIERDGRPFTVDYFGHEYSGTLDNWIDMRVYLFGAYEKPVLFAMRDVLAATNPNGDGVVIDVGANVGTHTLFLVNHAQTVHAIEPWPPVLKQLSRTLEENDVQNAVLHPVGFAAEPGEMAYHVPPGYNRGWGSFSDSFSEVKYDGGEGVMQLPLVVGDNYLASKGASHVDTIKIDIEGYEKPALQGLAQVMKRDRPTVFFELNVSNAEGFHSRDELLQTFPKNYRFFEVTTSPELEWRFGENKHIFCGYESGNYQLSPFDFDMERDSRNLAAMPAEVAEQMGKGS